MEVIKVEPLPWVQEGFNLYKDNLVLILICTIIAVVVSSCSFLILAAPMGVAYYRILSRLYKKSEPAPEIGDMLKGFDNFAQSILFFVIIFVIGMIVSFILNLLPLQVITSYAFNLVFGTAIMFSMPLIALRNTETIPAIQESVEVSKLNFTQLLLFMFISSIVSSAGILLLGFGIFLTIPVAPCAIIVAYHNIFGNKGETGSEPEASAA